MVLLALALFSACVDGALALSLSQGTPTRLVAVNGSALGWTKPICDSTFYGRDLKAASCREAVALMKNRYKARTYIQRNAQGPVGGTQSLPNRWLSCKWDRIS